MDILPYLLMLFPSIFPVGRGLRISTRAQETCRPTAFVFCEMPVITSFSDNEDSSTTFPAFPGEEFRLPCQAYGSPPPLIAWYRVLPNGESLIIPAFPAPGHHIVNDAGTLRIKHVVPHDDGKFFCMASNSVGDTKELVEIKVSHPLMSLIPISVSDTFVKLTWNGSVHISSFQESTSHPTSPSRRHHHHVETRYRLSRHLFLKYRQYRDFDRLAHATTVIKLGALAKYYTVTSLSPNTLYEFCIEFHPNERPATLLDCVTLRTTSEQATYTDSYYGYHQGHTIMFLLLMAIVGSVSCMCFGCYAVAVGRKLWKYKSSRGFTSLGYSDELDASESSGMSGAAYRGNPRDRYMYPYQYDDNPKRPLIARI